MAMKRLGKHADGTETHRGSTWGREFQGRFQMADASMAQNPRFEAEASAFELALGAKAFSHSAANGAAEAVCLQAVRYLDTRADFAAELGDAGQSIDELYQACGVSNSGWAGAVGTEVADVKAAMTQGNIRERLTAIQAFVENVLINDTLQTDQSYALLHEIMDDSGFYTRELEEFRASGSTSKWDSPFHAPGEDSKVSELDTMRARRSSDLGGGSVDTRTDMTTSTSPTELSSREASQQGMSSTNGQVDPDQRLQWAEGAKDLVMNENHKWVQLMRAISLPLKGGPSGHTHKFMMANNTLGAGVSPDDMRLACLGYLLPINAHSMVEVMEAAKPFGASYYPNDQKIYRYVSPMSEEELRQCGVDGRFPDESPDAGKTAPASEGQAA